VRKVFERELFSRRLRNRFVSKDTVIRRTTVKNAEKTVVASLVWHLPSELHELQADVVQRLGYQHRFFLFDEPIPSDAKIVLVQGPYGTLLPLTRQLVGCPPECRPVLAYWFQQSLDMRPPEWIRKPLAMIFSDLQRYYREAGRGGHRLGRTATKLVDTTRGGRLRFLGDILWLYHHNLLDVLALSSTVYAKYLAQCGITSILVPRGYHPDYGQILGLKRDIAVVWMGKTRNRRRKRAVYWLREQLEKHGQVMHIYDGEERDFIFGEKRTQILNRAWFVLNVLPDPTWEVSIRYYVSAANGAVVLTEPGENEYPFVPGKHLVECPIEKMPDTVTYYLEHEGEWRSISDAMSSLMKRDLTLEQSMASILTRAERVLDRRS
jgi:hypothetical protein